MIVINKIIRESNYKQKLKTSYKHTHKNMQYKHNSDLTIYAKYLRKNMTKEEKHLWYDFLKLHPEKFLKQKILGKYIVDFYCAKAKLVIEIDGTQHYENDSISYDNKRT